MASREASPPTDQSELLQRILAIVKSIQEGYEHLPAALEAIQGQVNVLAGIKQVQDAVGERHPAPPQTTANPVNHQVSHNDQGATDRPSSSRTDDSESNHMTTPRKYSTTTSRIILTTYPGQSGIDPLPMDWGNPDPQQRGPVVVSRSQSTIRRRNGNLTFPAATCNVSNSLYNSDRRSWWLLFYIFRLSCG